jgi:hypothetical protein
MSGGMKTSFIRPADDVDTRNLADAVEGGRSETAGIIVQKDTDGDPGGSGSRARLARSRNSFVIFLYGRVI